MATATDGRLRFPSQEVITAYLAKHPLTSDSYNQEKRINEAVAKAFANSTKVEMGVQMGVMLTMYDVNENLGLPESEVTAINMNLTQALIDCANGKAIQLEKSENKSQI